jgi:predicted XRE-type DNA-binding protein
MNKNQRKIAEMFARVSPVNHIPLKECDKCLYKQDPEGGHCYMFKNEPEGEFCGAFKRTELTLQRSVHVAVLSLMNEMGVTQAEVARRLNISRSAVTQFFEQSWTIDRLQSIAEVLGVTVSIKLNAPSEK